MSSVVDENGVASESVVLVPWRCQRYAARSVMAYGIAHWWHMPPSQSMMVPSSQIAGSAEIEGASSGSIVRLM